ncbi:MAG: response regulator transcription factor [Nitrosospira sp.]|nr:response regulator transcription factor [Nitrosospira sp.]
MSIPVLLVNSHQIVLWGLEKLINNESPRMKVVGKAINGAEASRLVREKKPEVILLDLYLGIEKVTELIPDLLSEGNTHVIIFTETRDQAAIDGTVLNGARGVVYKEDPTQNIIKAIEKVHAGELWLGRGTTGRIFVKFVDARQKPTDSITKKITTLTRKERAIISAFATDAGGSNKKIAQNLCISEQTLRNHLTSIFSKLEITNRFDLFMFAKLHHHRVGGTNSTSAPPAQIYS